MSRTVHVAMSIAAASQKRLREPQAHVPPGPIQTTPNRKSRISGHMTGLGCEVSGFFATRDNYPIDTAALFQRSTSGDDRSAPRRTITPNRGAPVRGAKVGTRGHLAQELGGALSRVVVPGWIEAADEVSASLSSLARREARRSFLGRR